jgi:lipopolysaccharide biosynthesis regulator YciM
MPASELHKRIRAHMCRAFVMSSRWRRGIVCFPVAISALLILASLDASLAREMEGEVADDSAAAKANADSSTDQLASREMEIGRYNLGRKNYTGALNRFKVVVTQYRETRHVEEALEHLTELYLVLGIVREAQTAVAVLGRKFPDSRWYTDALDLLKRAGLEPHEDEGSWISRAFK